MIPVEKILQCASFYVFEKYVVSIALPPRSVEPRDFVRDVFMMSENRVGTDFVLVKIRVSNPTSLENEEWRRRDARVTLWLLLISVYPSLQMYQKRVRLVTDSCSLGVLRPSRSLSRLI